MVNRVLAPPRSAHVTGAVGQSWQCTTSGLGLQAAEHQQDRFISFAAHASSASGGRMNTLQRHFYSPM